MLDIGGWEFLIVAFVLVMVVGPKELPRMLRSFTGILRQVRRMANEFTSSMTDLANESDMADLKKTLDQAKSGDLSKIADAIDPGGDVSNAVGDLTEAAKSASGNDIDQIKSIAKETGDELASSTKAPEKEEATPSVSPGSPMSPMSTGSPMSSGSSGSPMSSGSSASSASEEEPPAKATKKAPAKSGAKKAKS